MFFGACSAEKVSAQSTRENKDSDLLSNQLKNNNVGVFILTGIPINYDGKYVELTNIGNQKGVSHPSDYARVACCCDNAARRGVR